MANSEQQSHNADPLASYWVARHSKSVIFLILILAAVGLYGVMAHAVTRRVREIGIRMALGAKAGEVRWLVLRETALMVGIGAAIGIPAAFCARGRLARADCRAGRGGVHAGT